MAWVGVFCGALFMIQQYLAQVGGVSLLRKPKTRSQERLDSKKRRYKQLQADEQRQRERQRKTVIKKMWVIEEQLVVACFLFAAKRELLRIYTQGA